MPKQALRNRPFHGVLYIPTCPRPTHRPDGGAGFTLIELMLVVAIIGLLAAIAIPKFGNLVTKAKEAAVKGKLGSLRSAISIYYADNESVYPRGYFVGNLNPAFRFILMPKYIQEIPTISIPNVSDHPSSNDATSRFNGTDWPWWNGSRMAYAFDTADGVLTVNCTHTDSTGVTWSLW